MEQITQPHNMENKGHTYPKPIPWLETQTTPLTQAPLGRPLVIIADGSNAGKTNIVKETH